jgi:hypothetical protein
MIRFAVVRKPLLALVAVLALTGVACAQEGPRGLWPDTPESLARDAVSTPYADALLKQFVANVRKDGDAACLQAKGLDDAALTARGRSLWQVRGVQTLTLFEQAYDRKVYEEAVAEAAGRDVPAELERLRKDAGVKKLIEISRPLKLANAINHLVEEFDRYVLVARIKLDPVHPLGRGESDSDTVRANPVKATQTAIQQFYDRQSSKKVERYLDLVDATTRASPKGFKKEELRKLGPTEYFAGADKELAEMCIGKR